MYDCCRRDAVISVTRFRYATQERQANSEPTYLKAREIADDIGEMPKAVAQHLHRLQTELTGITLEQWGRSKSITWLAYVLV